MRDCPDSEARVGLVGIRRRLQLLQREQNGAVLLLCLAAILILLLMSWMVLDGIFVTYDKTEAQASADMAAYSQASVKAKSMNMLAFTNVAKRSLVGVHTTYYGMFNAFIDWLFGYYFFERCDPMDNWDECSDASYQENFQLWNSEDSGDFEEFLDNDPYFVADLRAIDTYQRYIDAMTPWWGWSEMVLRAQRNGATLATSYPAPRRGEVFPFTRVNDQVRAEVPGVGSMMTPSSRVEELPVQRGILGDDGSDIAMERGMERDEWINWEQQRNVEIHTNRSEHGAASGEVVDMALSAQIGDILIGLYEASATATESIGNYGRPYALRGIDNEARWLFSTSNIVMTYHHQPEYFRRTREKYEPFGNDYLPEDETIIDVETYQPRGYWGLARAEISYQADEEPNLWRPAWTARMRPVALPNEFHDAGERFNRIYYSTVDYLLLSAHLHDDTTHDTGDFFNDLVYFEKVSRAMGQSTIEGVGK